VGVIWPVPSVTPGFTQVDEQLPEPPRPPTVEERLARLEAAAVEP
jgi:hypothetical protein